MNQAEADEDRAPSEAEIEKTFYTRRLPRLPWSLLLVLYVPFGLFLTLLRVCMSLQAILLLAFFPEGAVKRFLLRVFFAVLGIIVITDSFHRKGSQTKVYIGNKVSHLDHIVLHLALDCITVGTGGAAPLLHFLFPHRQLSSHSPEALETEAKRLPEFDGVSLRIAPVHVTVCLQTADQLRFSLRLSFNLNPYPPTEPTPCSSSGRL
jgi:hypothetical protein